MRGFCLVNGGRVWYNKTILLKEVVKMLIVTTNEVANRKHEVIGLTQGSVVRAKNALRDMAAGFKSVVGGEIKGYTQLMQEARGIATQRMIEQAQQMGADAVIAVRYSTCSVMNGSSEVMAFGTAVKFV